MKGCSIGIAFLITTICLEPSLMTDRWFEGLLLTLGTGLVLIVKSIVKSFLRK